MALWLAGNPVEAVRFADRALEAATASGDVGSRISANEVFGRIHHTLGNYDQAIGYLEQNLNLIRDPRSFGFGSNALPSVFSGVWLAWSLGELGQFDRALSVARGALEIATAAQHAFSLVSAQWATEWPRVLRGDGTGAIPGLVHEAQLPCQPRSHGFGGALCSTGAAVFLKLRASKRAIE